MDGKLFLTAAALLLVAACTKEDSGAAFRSDPDAVRITAQVGDGLSGGFVTTRSNPVSEAPDEQAAFKSGDKVCVTADGQKKVVYTYDGTAWNPEAGKYLKWTSRTMTFSACYPAADGVSATHFTVPADQSDADKIAAADYMTFSAEVTRGSNNGVTLGLTRKMVRIVVEPAIQNQFGGEYYISEIKVHGNRKGYSGGNLVNGDVAVKACQLGGKFYALLPPTHETGDLPFIDVTVTDGSDTRTLTANIIPYTEAGKSYTVSLKVGKNVASVTEVSISEWGTTSTPIANGEEAVLVPYITFTAEAEQTFTMNFQPQSWYDAFSLKEGDYFEYSVGGGKWTRFTSTISDENAVAFGGAKGNLRLRGKSSKGTADSSNKCSTISFTTSNSPVQCIGDIRTLIDYENYATANTENARYCYLFSGCTALTTAPELPAMTLANQCYFGMFANCSNLTQAPTLPAETLKDRCYASMFDGCSSLTTAPELPAMTLDVFCYSYMFQACTSLTTAPVLPATELKQACYYGMFYNCRNLKTAPVLHATTLVGGCYLKIFNNCRGLENVTMLATDGFDSSECLDTWLGYYKDYGGGSVDDSSAGKNASTRTLTLANEEVYNKLVAKESTDEKTWITDYWKKDANGTTVVYKDNSSGLGEGGSEI